MNEEEFKNGNEEVQHQMYVQQVDWETFKPLVSRVTNVNRLYMYNMPNKAERYASDVVSLIQTLDEYLSGDEDWRVTDEKNVEFGFNVEEDKIVIGSWVFGKPLAILCIPKLNSFFIIPDNDATYKGSKSPTHVLQLSNCISIMPMLLTMREVPDNEKEGVINIAMAYEMVSPPTEEKPTE